MGGVDKDKNYSLEKKGGKWYKKLLTRLLNISIYNAPVLFSASPQDNKQDHLTFRMQLIRELLDQWKTV
jgi:hypothetical protein